MKLFRSNDTREANQSLWFVVASPLIWVGHFLVSYLTAAIWCAKAGGPQVSLFPVRLTIGIATALALAGIAIMSLAAYRRLRAPRPASPPPHNEATPLDRHRFLARASLLLSGLSAVAVIFVAFTAIFIHDCH